MEKYKIIKDEFQGYAIFSQQYYQSGDKSFMQQVSKWYFYRKAAEKCLNRFQG